MSVEENKRVARRFIEGMDSGDPSINQEIFKPNAVRHFPAMDVVMPPDMPLRPRIERESNTKIHHLYGEGDLVTIHLTHQITNPGSYPFQTRMGTFDAGGRYIEWNAMVILRFEEGKIAEEWVVRDELQVLLQLEVVKAE